MLFQTEKTTSTSIQNTDFNVRHVLFVTNDGQFPIRFDFDMMQDDTTGIVLKPGETVSSIDVIVNRLYYKSIGGSSVIRGGGVKYGAY